LRRATAIATDGQYDDLEACVEDSRPEHQSYETKLGRFQHEGVVGVML